MLLLYQGMLKPVLKEVPIPVWKENLQAFSKKLCSRTWYSFQIDRIFQRQKLLFEWMQYDAIKGYHTAMMNEAKEIAQEGIPEAEMFEIEDDTIKTLYLIQRASFQKISLNDYSCRRCC